MASSTKNRKLLNILHNEKPLGNLKVLIITWNVGNAEPEGLEAILGSPEELDEFDVVVFGMQESTFSLPKTAQEKDCIMYLFNKLKELVGVKYFTVAHCHRAQLQLYVFGKAILRGRITNIEMSIENTGFLHVFPNKGGLLVTFCLDGTKLAFVSCHLTAHEGVKHCEERNVSIVEILGGVRAGDTRIDITEQFHHVFWMGDMNYRLTFDSKAPESTKKNIKALKTQASTIQFENSTTKKEEAKTETNGKLTKGNSLNLDVEVIPDVDDEDEEEEEENKEGTTPGGSNNNSSKKAVHKNQWDKLVAMISWEQWEKMLELDELNREMRAGRILNGFLALQPRFPPTFKRKRHLSIAWVDEEEEGVENNVAGGRAASKANVATLRGEDHAAEFAAVVNSETADPNDVNMEFFGTTIDDFEGVVQISNGKESETTPGEGNGATASSTANTPTSPRMAMSPRQASITGHHHIKVHRESVTSEAELAANEGQLVSEYYDPKRLPSFTDRVLYKSMRTYTNMVTPMFFDSVELALSSDHKPVIAGFNVKLTQGKRDILVNKDILEKHNKKNLRVGHKLRFRIHDLRGENLEEMDDANFGGGSDPYIVVTTDPPSLLLQNERIAVPKHLLYSSSQDDELEYHATGVKSSVIKHNLNPVWTEELKLAFASMDLEGLGRNATIIFQVWDEDLYNAHDLIGCMTIPLKDVLQSLLQGKSFAFHELLRSNSEVMGKLHGHISLDGNIADLEPLFVEIAQVRSNSTSKEVSEQYITLHEAEHIEAHNNAGCLTQCNCSIQ